MPSVDAECTWLLCQHNRSFMWNVSWKASMKGKAVDHIY